MNKLPRILIYLHKWQDSQKALAIPIMVKEAHADPPQLVFVIQFQGSCQYSRMLPGFANGLGEGEQAEIKSRQDKRAVSWSMGNQDRLSGMKQLIMFLACEHPWILPCSQGRWGRQHICTLWFIYHLLTPHESIRLTRVACLCFHHILLDYSNVV